MFIIHEADVSGSTITVMLGEKGGLPNALPYVQIIVIGHPSTFTNHY